MGEPATDRRPPVCPVRKGDLAVVWWLTITSDRHFRQIETRRLVVAVVAQATRDGFVRKVTWRGRTEWVALPLPYDDKAMRAAMHSPAERVVAVLERARLTDYRRVLALVDGREYDDIDAVKAQLRPYRVEP